METINLVEKILVIFKTCKLIWGSDTGYKRNEIIVFEFKYPIIEKNIIEKNIFSNLERNSKICSKKVISLLFFIFF